jgi:ubiquinone/menaquinone biosynthesis C-methylase UbiE
MKKVSKDFNPSIIHPLYIVRKNLYRGVAKYAPQLTGKMMDFGCGEKPYKSLFNNISEYTGVDYDGEGHKHDKEEIDIYYDGKTIPFPGNTFDSILTTEVLEHIFNVEDILKELCRVLKPSGKILITIPFAWMEHEAPVDFGRYTSFGMKSLLERNGFKILALEKTTNYIQTQTQLTNVYWNNHFFPKLRPFATVSSYFFCCLNNIYGLTKAKILPAKNDWYLNLVILAEKRGE